MGVHVRIIKNHYYLDIYQNGARRCENLHMTRTGNAALDKEKDRMAEICRAKKEMQLLAGEYKIIDRSGARAPLYTYMEGIASTKKAKNHYSKALKYLAKFPGGMEIRLNQIDEAWLIAWQRFLQKEGLSSATVRHYDDAVRLVLNQAVRERRISHNPGHAVPGVTVVTKMPDILTREDLEKLVATPVGGELGEEARRAFLFACWTGLRISDIRTLEWKNIDGGKIRLVMHKTAQIVEVPLHPMAMAQLEANEEKLVFPKVGKTKTNCITYFDRWAADAGVDKKIGWHTARRTFATLAVEAGVDQYVISKLLGHTSIRHTATYSQVPITVKRSAVAKLPDFGGTQCGS